MTSGQPSAPIDKLLETLQERAKELNCLYRVHELLDRPEASLDEVCRGMVETLPSGWQYPAVCWARVTLEGVVYEPPGISESPWVQSAKVVVQGQEIGLVEVGYSKQAIPQRSNLQIRGVEFCYYGRDAFHRAIYIDGGDSNVVERCFFHHNGVGVAFKRAADFNTIQRCVFTESPVATWSWHAVKDSGSDYESGGVLIYGSTETNRGNVIRHCTFTNLFDASHLYSDDAAGPTENLDFHHNVIQGCNDDGVETDGAGSNCRIYANRFHGFLTGVSVAPATIGPTYIFRNILSDWRPSEEFEGYPFKFNVSSSLPIQWVYLYHNTCYTAVPGQHGFWFKQYSNWTNVISRNNVYAGTHYALESQVNFTSNVDFDYDCLFTTKAPPVIRWDGVNYNSLAEFIMGVGEEPHGITNQPVTQMNRSILFLTLALAGFGRWRWGGLGSRHFKKRESILTPIRTFGRARIRERSSHAGNGPLRAG